MNCSTNDNFSTQKDKRERESFTSCLLSFSGAGLAVLRPSDRPDGIARYFGVKNVFTLL